MARAGLEPRTAGLRVQSADHLATLPPTLPPVHVHLALWSAVYVCSKYSTIPSPYNFRNFHCFYFVLLSYIYLNPQGLGAGVK